MNFIVGLLASLVVVQAAPYNGLYSYPAAATLVRAPAHDSAIVHSNRFGANFGYSIAQRHAYQVVAPPRTVALYNHQPFGYPHHQFNQFPFGATIPGHHVYIQHPNFLPAVGPGFVSVVYPNQHPAEYPEVEQTEPNADGESTEDPDAENVEIDNPDIDATREETMQETVEGSNDNADDSVLVEAF